MHDGGWKHTMSSLLFSTDDLGRPARDRAAVGFRSARRLGFGVFDRWVVFNLDLALAARSFLLLRLLWLGFGAIGGIRFRLRFDGAASSFGSLSRGRSGRGSWRTVLVTWAIAAGNLKIEFFLQRANTVADRGRILVLQGRSNGMHVNLGPVGLAKAEPIDSCTKGEECFNLQQQDSEGASGTPS